MSGSDVTLLSAKKISIGSGTYILSGIDISIIADVGRKIAVGEGAYGLSGSGMDIKFGTSAYYDVDVETFHRENVPVSVMRSAGGSSVARPDDLEPAKGRPN